MIIWIFSASDTNIGAANGLADLEEHYGLDYAMDLIKGMAIPVMEFQVRGYKIINILPKNQHTQRK